MFPCEHWNDETYKCSNVLAELNAAPIFSTGPVYLLSGRVTFSTCPELSTVYLLSCLLFPQRSILWHQICI